MEDSKVVKRVRELRPTLDIVDVSQWNKAKWLSYRQGGLGCSEIGTVLGLNKWSEPGIVFSQKLGIIPTGTVDSAPMFFGREFESKILDLWEYYNPQDEVEAWQSVKNNKDKNNKVRRALKPELYAVNPNLPFLFGGCDGMFKHNDDLGVLEVKTISGYSRDQYEGGVPPSYIMQVHGYMMVFDCEYAEICFLVDGNKFEVMPFERNQNLCEIIYENCYSFWENVKKAREAMQVNEDWLEFEPEPSDSIAYEEFLKERFRANNDATVPADEKTMEHIKGLLKARDVKKSAEKEILLHSNNLKYHMGEATEITDLDEGYRCSWRRGDNDRRRFSCTYKQPK